MIKQTDRVLAYMKEYGGITPKEAETMIGCMRLAARIAELRANGYKIASRSVSMVNRYGRKTRYCEYKLEDQA